MDFSWVKSSTPDSLQKKIVQASIKSKIIWGASFSGKSITLCWRAQYLKERQIEPVILCFSTYQRRYLRRILEELALVDTVKLLSFREWTLKCLTRDSSLAKEFVRVIEREEILAWLKKHQGQWTGNHEPEQDYEIIWAEKLDTDINHSKEYVELLEAYQAYLHRNQLIDEIDLFFLMRNKVLPAKGGLGQHFLIDEIQEASSLDLQLIGLLATQSMVELFCDYNKSMMSWRTPLGPLRVNDIKKILKIKKNFYLNQNYITPKSIWNRSLQVLRRNKNRISKRVAIKSKVQGTTQFYLADLAKQEGEFLRETVNEFIKELKFDTKRIGVLVRNHQQAYAIADYLEGLLPSPYFSNRLLRQPGAVQILAFLRVLIGAETDFDLEVLFTSMKDSKLRDVYLQAKNILNENRIYLKPLLKNEQLLQRENYTQRFVLIQHLGNEEWGVEKFSAGYIGETPKWYFKIKIFSDQSWEFIPNEGFEEIVQELKEERAVGFYQGAYFEAMESIPNVCFMAQSALLDYTERSFEEIAYAAEVFGVAKKLTAEIRTFKELISTWQSRWGEACIQDLLSVRLFFEYLDDSTDADKIIGKIKTIFEESRLVHLDQKENLKLFLKSCKTSITSRIENEDKVTLCTIHEGRHLLFDWVILPCLHQFEFPHVQSCSGVFLEEERRLFATALLRSKDTVIVMANKENHVLSQFIYEAKFL